MTLLTLNNNLLDYQQKAVDKLMKYKVGALLMEQGTGKTITTLEMIRQRYIAGKITKVIWLCPCNAKMNIKLEIEKQAPKAIEEIITICGIETLSSSQRTILKMLDLADKDTMLVIDEALLIKNPFAKRSMAIDNIARKCRYKMILNGTPISRNEADLYMQYCVLDWRILGYQSYYCFAANHLEYDEYGKVRKVLDTDYLAEKISPYSYQVKKEDCLQLPKKVYSSYGFDLTREQFELYVETSERLLQLITDEGDFKGIYRLFSGCSAVLAGKRLKFENEYHFETFEFFDDPRDNPRIKATLKCLDKEKTIIFCRYKSEIDALMEILGDKAVRFDGSISRKQREKNLKEFQNDKLYLIGNKRCMGYSLNLQFCHKIVFMNNDWDLGTRLQSEDRVHRIGQKEQIKIIDIFAEDTLDVRILNCLYRKEDLLNSIQQNVKDQQSLKEILKQKLFSKEE